MQVEETYIWGKNERETGEFCYSMTITNSLLVVQPIKMQDLHQSTSWVILNTSNIRVRYEYIRHTKIYMFYTRSILRLFIFEDTEATYDSRRVINMQQKYSANLLTSLLPPNSGHVIVVHLGGYNRTICYVQLSA